MITPRGEKLVMVIACILSIHRLPGFLWRGLGPVLATSRLWEWPSIVLGVMVALACFCLELVGIRWPSAMLEAFLRASTDKAWKKRFGDAAAN